MYICINIMYISIAHQIHVWHIFLYLRPLFPAKLWPVHEANGVQVLTARLRSTGDWAEMSM